LLTVSFYFRLCISNAAERRKPSVKNSWDQGDQIGWFFARWVMFTLCSFFNYPSSRHFGVLFPQLRLCNNFGKNRLGCTLCDFFTNSSGHPVSDHRNPERPEQGDQIGRIIACWAIVYFGHYYKL
jgi:hypothetical protein